MQLIVFIDDVDETDEVVTERSGDFRLVRSARLNKKSPYTSQFEPPEIVEVLHDLSTVCVVYNFL